MNITDHDVEVLMNTPDAVKQAIVAGLGSIRKANFITIYYGFRYGKIRYGVFNYFCQVVRATSRDLYKLLFMIELARQLVVEPDLQKILANQPYKNFINMNLH